MKSVCPDEAADEQMVSNTDLDAQVLEIDARHGARVLQSVYDFIGRFVSYPSEHARVAHSLWIVHTHMMEVWDSTPRLAFLSAEPASGKTRALEVTELLVPNPVSTVNVSPAYLFRKVGSDDGATILFDEIDTVFGPKAKDNEYARHNSSSTTVRPAGIVGKVWNYWNPRRPQPQSHRVRALRYIRSSAGGSIAAHIRQHRERPAPSAPADAGVIGAWRLLCRILQPSWLEIH